jgi:hypothetical protein
MAAFQQPTSVRESREMTKDEELRQLVLEAREKGNAVALQLHAAAMNSRALETGVHAGNFISRGEGCANSLMFARTIGGRFFRTVGLRLFPCPDVAAHFHFLKNPFEKMVSATSFFNNTGDSHGRQRRGQHAP